MAEVWKGGAVITTAERAGAAGIRKLDAGGLLEWAERTGRRQVMAPGRGGLRFAFYGRVSTEDYQDPLTSLARQLGQAGTLIAGHGQIAAEFFDIGQSRTLAWGRRPQAAPTTRTSAPSGPAPRTPQPSPSTRKLQARQEGAELAGRAPALAGGRGG